MRLFIEPNDVWLFRDGRPFDVCAGHRARTLFPPFPSVIQGMIRSAYLTFCGVGLDDYLQDKAPLDIIKEIGKAGSDPPETFKLSGPFVARRLSDDKLERYFPRPADAYTHDDRYLALMPDESTTDALSNLPEGLKLLVPRENPASGKVKVHDDWWRESALQDYLTGGRVEQSKLHDHSTGEPKPITIFVRENRFGIHLQEEVRRVRKGFIYEIEFARLEKDFGLEVEIEGLSQQWPPSGMVRLGGDGRTARFTTLDHSQSLPQISSTGGNTKIYFATPACFDEGWQPKSWAKFFGVDVKPVAAALEKPLSGGGINLANTVNSKRVHEMHKPARRYVPAGSVYFFEGESKLQKNVRAITDHGADIGFGQVIFGRW